MFLLDADGSLLFRSLRAYACRAPTVDSSAALVADAEEASLVFSLLVFPIRWQGLSCILSQRAERELWIAYFPCTLHQVSYVR